MSGGRPTLKLKLNRPQQEEPAEEPSAQPPTPASGGAKKLKLKFGSKSTASDAQTANGATPKKGKGAATSKSKSKPSSGKKRTRDASKQSDAAPGEAHPPVKRIKLNTKPKPAPRVRFSMKGKPRPRPKGYGYDSEASDTEMDPALEEEFILRMQPGEDCDYLRQAVAEKRFGSRSQGGADVSFKALTKDGRRATVTIRGRIYAASLVDLPCIIEGMKSWDKRGWYKAADICQMLLVLGQITSEEETFNYPLPKEVDPTTFQYAHGLTPPLRFVRKRRFRNRISNRTIEAVELEVARLLKQDEEAIDPPDFEVMDYSQYVKEQQGGGDEEGDYEGYDEDQDAEGEADEYFEQEPGADEEGDDAFEDELAAEMEAALAAHAEASTVPAPTTDAAVEESQAPQGAEGEEEEEEAGAEGEDVEAEGEAEAEVEGEVEGEGEGESELFEAGTPQTKHTTGGESSGDEDESDGSSPDEDAAQDLDEDALAQQRQLQEQREEIVELESLLQRETRKWEMMNNPILKTKLSKQVQKIQQELSLKKLSIGEGED